MKKTITTLFLAITIVLSFTACSSKYDKYITEVKNGYLGGCLDVSVEELFKETMPNGKWDGGETDDGEIIVEYQGELSGSKVRIQFTAENENQFKVSAIKGETVQPKSASEAAAIIESRYMQYYSYQYPDRAAAELMPNEPAENLLNGISADYAEKAKNPIDIANYFDKSEQEINALVGIDGENGEWSTAEIALSYDHENARVGSATLKGSRVYSLFGLQTYQRMDTAAEKIGDRFENISEEPREDGDFIVTYIRNNSEDALFVTYDTDTGSVTEIAYIYNGLAGYREEQERIRKEEEERARAEAEAAARRVNSAQKAINMVREARQISGEAANDNFAGNQYSAEEYSQYYLVDVTATRNVNGTSRYKVYKSTGQIEFLGAGSEW